MNEVLSIRKKLGLSQTELAQAIGVSQPNVAHYERGQTIPPKVAQRLIVAAAKRGVCITYNDIYR